RGGGLIGARDPALGDAGALADPAIVGVERRCEVVIGDDGVGHRATPSTDAHPHVRPQQRSHATGWPGRTRSPLWAIIPMRNPVNRLHTGVTVAPEVTWPMVWPSIT